MVVEILGLQIELIYVFCGLFVGFIVGMTGIGGGSLMTPILLYLGITPTTAVGTDLLYAAITKAGGVAVHQRQGNINWRITGLLAAGSVPAALLTLYCMHLIGFDSHGVNSAIKTALGITLILTAVAILFKQQLIRWSQANDLFFTRLSNEKRERATVFVGVILGVMVTLTSIGAGVLGTVALFLLFPMMPVSRLVGTEIAHAVPLTLVAGLGYMGMGSIDWNLLFTLLLGSLPGIFIGSLLPGAIPEKFMRPALATMMGIAALKLLS